LAGVPKAIIETASSIHNRIFNKVRFLALLCLSTAAVFEWFAFQMRFAALFQTTLIDQKSEFNLNMLMVEFNCTRNGVFGIKR